MGKYIIKRLLQLIPVLIGITFLSFAMMRLAGGDAVTYMYENAGSAVSQEVIDNAKAEYGLDKPFLVQYAAWFAGMVTGDMGESYVSHRDVYETFISKLPATMMLTLSSILLTIVLAIPLGILSAVKHNKWVDYLIRFLSFIGNSMPNFCCHDPDVFSVHQAGRFTGSHKYRSRTEYYSADTDTGDLHGCKIYQTGACHGFGRTE